MRRFPVAGLLLLLPVFVFSASSSGASEQSAKTVHLSPQALDAYAGSYRLAPNFVLNIFRRNDQLYAQATGQGAFQIFPSAKNEFFVRIADIRISFQRDKHGKVTGLVLHQHGDHSAPRIANADHGARTELAEDSCKTHSQEILHALQKGTYDAAGIANFDAAMKKAISAQMNQFWSLLSAHYGAFDHADAAQTSHEDGSLTLITSLVFADGRENLHVTCNQSGDVIGLFLTPGQTTAGAGAAQAAIMIQRNGFALKGVLDLPAGKGPFPVVDIIPGSGSVNINGNGGGIAYSPYKKLAAALVKAGWAVARVAKRGMPPSTGDGNHIVFSDQVADNLAIVETLRKNPHVNPGRIVVAGHSIGGLIAPKLATETHLAGLILLEAPSESMTKITTAQVLEMNRQAGASATQLAAIKKKQEGFYPKIAQTAPGKSLNYAGHDLPAWEVQLLKSLYVQKPLATARKVKIPVLVVQGGMDFNVPTGNGKRLVAALPDGKLLYLPKMGHALDVAHCRCTKQLDTGQDAMLAPGLAAGIIHWLQSL